MSLPPVCYKLLKEILKKLFSCSDLHFSEKYSFTLLEVVQKEKQFPHIVYQK